MDEDEVLMRTTATTHLVTLIGMLDSGDRDKLVAFLDLAQIAYDAGRTPEDDDLAGNLLRDVHDALWEHPYAWQKLADDLRPLGF